MKQLDVCIGCDDFMGEQLIKECLTFQNGFKCILNKGSICNQNVAYA
jgi:hypothetical protein